MTDAAGTGTVRTQTDGHVFRIEVDNVAKKNACTPDMMEKLSDAFTAFDVDDARCSRRSRGCASRSASR
jgi:enoyl-CoA hydratase